MRPARHPFAAASCLVSAGLLTTSLVLEARVTRPPSPPLDPGSALPGPSATPSDPGKGGMDSTEPPDKKATDDDGESENAGVLSPPSTPSIGRRSYF